MLLFGNILHIMCVVTKEKQSVMNYLISNFDRGVDKLPVIASVKSHSMVPEMFEEVWQDLIHNVLGLHTICTAALFHYLRQQNKIKINYNFSIKAF